MVLLHVKRGDESQFLLETAGSTSIEDLTLAVTRIYNGRLKVQRVCAEMEMLAEHGILLPPNMQGLTDEQIEELKLKDEWAEKCIPSGGSVFKKDEIGRRNGHAPNEKMKQVLKATIDEAKALISKKQVQANVCVNMDMVKDALDQLRGAVMIVYPMGLPPYDPIRMEFEDKEYLSGTQDLVNRKNGWLKSTTGGLKKIERDFLHLPLEVLYPKGSEDPHGQQWGQSGGSSEGGWSWQEMLPPALAHSAALEIIEEPEAQLWWAAKELKRTNQLSDYVGKNEKTKIIVKIQKKGQGAPAREPVISNEEHKQMMLYYYKRQEELKKLEENDDDSCLDSEWADSRALKRHFHGVKDIKWRPR